MATKKKNTSTTADGNDEKADVSKAELKKAANAGAAEKTKQNPKTEVKAEKRGEHVPHQNFREAVHQSPVTLVDEDLGIGPRDPYPTGNPRPQEDIEAEVRGVVPTKPEDNADA
jgi:hypothetical protein